MFAYIPARIGSKRIPKKNIKMLHGKPVICHVIENLIGAGISKIAVSTDSDEIVQVVSEYKQVATLELRDPSLSDDKTGFNELIDRDMERYCRHFQIDDVLFTLATAALVSPRYFQEGAKLHSEHPASLVMAVGRYEMSPMLTLIKEPDGSLRPLFPDEYLKDTKDLRPGFYDCGSFYIFNRKFFYGKLLDIKPVLSVEVPKDIGIDVDDPKDWAKLEKSI